MGKGLSEIGYFARCPFIREVVDYIYKIAEGFVRPVDFITYTSFLLPHGRLHALRQCLLAPFQSRLFALW